MNKLLPAVLALSAAGCSGMGGMQSSGQSSFAGTAGSAGTPSSSSAACRDESREWTSSNVPVIDPCTGRLTLYHGG